MYVCVFVARSDSEGEQSTPLEVHEVTSATATAADSSPVRPVVRELGMSAF